jgi:glutamate-ammonia-ligase adenylyltransferase
MDKDVIQNRMDSWGLSCPDFLEIAIHRAPSPELAVMNLDRMIDVIGQDSVWRSSLTPSPGFERLIMLMGTSRPMGDLLVQNPEYLALVLDPSVQLVGKSAESIHAECRRVVSLASSHSHRLDRLRHFKQEETLLIALAELDPLIAPDQVWAAISDVADALIHETANVVWANMRMARPELSETLPVSIVAFGKLGGHELNYSSDIDLAFLVPDSLSDEEVGQVTRFGEVLSRALADPMGRGSLYRVDFRLRPYGRSGPLVNKVVAAEAYYARYAEAWEWLALIRSRVIVGDSEMADRWEAIRTQSVFRATIGEWVIEDLLDQRRRTEGIASDDDLKRGEGGIRDIEFLVQILQLIYGESHPGLQGRPTLEMLKQIDQMDVLPKQEVAFLASAYTQLRQIEHRLQVIDNRQTQTLPSNKDDQLLLARSLGYSSYEAFLHHISDLRAQVRRIYNSTFSMVSDEETTLEEALQKRFGSLAPSVKLWLDLTPNPEQFGQALIENRDTADIVERVVTFAPTLKPWLTYGANFLENLWSGEIQEEGEETTALTGEELRRNWNIACARAVLQNPIRITTDLTRQAESVLRQVINPELVTVIALGSFAAVELGPASDLDLVFFSSPEAEPGAAERHAESVLRTFNSLRQQGSPWRVDLRLRPEGRSGALVSTIEGFDQYELDAMEPWERLALARSRLLSGDSSCFVALRRAAANFRLTASSVAALKGIKKRVETERLSPYHIHRDLKLGHGGLMDLEWTLQYLAWKHPEPASWDHSAETASRIRSLAKAGVLDPESALILHEAWTHLVSSRVCIQLLGFELDVLPENPDRLDKLADAMGREEHGGTQLLEDHQRLTSRVRRLFDETFGSIA